MPIASVHPFNSRGPRRRVWISERAAQAVARAAMAARVGNRKLLDSLLEDEHLLGRAAEALVKRLAKGCRAQTRGKTLKTAVGSS